MHDRSQMPAKQRGCARVHEYKEGACPRMRRAGGGQRHRLGHSRSARKNHASNKHESGSAMTRGILMTGLVFAFGIHAGAAVAQTLKNVKDRGSLLCGVTQGLPGFSNPDDKGNWSGLDVDFCRALAAAILNDSAKVKFTPLSAKDRFEPLKTGDIDVLSRNTTWTLSRDVAYGNFAGVTYYDGQGFMVRKALKVNSALELNGASVCTQT